MSWSIGCKCFAILSKKAAPAAFFMSIFDGINAASVLKVQSV
jgi:hypothetical protein